MCAIKAHTYTKYVICRSRAGGFRQTHADGILGDHCPGGRNCGYLRLRSHFPLPVLKIAIQKKGRLSDDSIELLSQCGIRFSKADNKLKAQAWNFPLEILFLRDDDIPGYVADGVADVGIVGENVLYETGLAVQVAEKLGFGKCRLSIAVPNAVEYTQLSQLKDQRIATSYPRLLGAFLQKNGIEARIHEISGSVEIAPGIGLADAICDLVSSGSTLISNGLKEAEVILKSEAVLICNTQLSTEAQRVLADLSFRIRSVLQGRNYKYILLNAPDAAIPTITSLLPGIKSPTVMPLREPGWSSLHSVVQENDFWEIIGRLREAGAEGILVLPIEKIIQ
ncbi:MAG: ATP phosphoribosyltransferase [Bacteroidetes bacterium]|nr:ATP phosphoribosyltransferase [Bacteroidota bacterium]